MYLEASMSNHRIIRDILKGSAVEQKPYRNTKLTDKETYYDYLKEN